MKVLLPCSILFAALTITTEARAAVYACTGPITFLEMNANGQVTANFGGLQFATYCQVGATANGISSEACKAIYSMLLAARLSGASMTQSFNDTLTCATHPAWIYLTGMWGGPSL
jgi:hypothetical protein